MDTVQRLASEAREKFQLESTNASSPGTSGSVGRSYFRVFFAGVQPRVMWISIGGFVFFGAYEQALRIVFPIVGSN